ncbi:MAG: type II toxin-antitoxin system RelE/ParE family toxin [Syntrophobacterales bacterium]|nr:type II toxin-antitoxin system RelE/ParE family toxin [Syntrophobacterales bacterium]
MILEWLPTAQRDFDDLVDYIAADQPLAAIEQGDKIETQVSLLIDKPRMGRPGRVKGTRELVVVRSPFIVVYRIKGKTIQILRVLHGAQQWPRRFSR